jgi:alpha-ketoglutaric semialdehyde dehydrogenase
MHMITGQNLIGNSYSGAGSNIFSSSVKEDGSLRYIDFHEASPEETNGAVMAAADAFAVFRLCETALKRSFLDSIATGIANAKDALVRMAMHETNLPSARLEGEVQRTINQVKLFSALLAEGSWVRPIIDTAQPNRIPLPKPDIRQVQVPLGPVAVFGASNFPFAFSVAGGDTISALAAGCPVVYKAHPGHPATSEMVGAIVVEAVKNSGLPEGVFSLLQGRSPESSIRLVEHPGIKAVGFTGSFTAGKAIFDAANARKEPIPVYAEMGSINPVFILPGIMEKEPALLAQKLAASNLLGAGQFCTNPGVIVSVEAAATSEFLAGFSNHIKNAGAESMLNEQLAKNYQNGVDKLISSGVQLNCSGKNTEAPIPATPYMFQTSAINFLKDKGLSHEVFGPSSIHVVAGTEAELYAVARQLEGQLTVSIWGTEADLLNFARLVNELELKAGRIIFNNVPTGVEVTHAMMHGGPFPSTTNSQATSVGTNAIYRFTRPVSYQNFPQQSLPASLRNENSLGLWRHVNGSLGNGPVAE